MTRLIDADELIDRAYRERLDSRERIAQLIESAPTIDAVKHGRWITAPASSRWFKDVIFRCSNCGNYLDFRGVNAGRGDANFCPVCGARMDGDV